VGEIEKNVVATQGSDGSPPAVDMFGRITRLISRLAKWLCWPSRQLLGLPSDPKNDPSTPILVAKFVQRIDTYVAAWLALEILFYAVAAAVGTIGQPSRWVTLSWWALLVLLLWRPIEIVAYAILTTVTVRLVRGGSPPPLVAAPVRVVVLGVLNYLELILCFAGIYALGFGAIEKAKDWFDPMFLSTTLLTVGYSNLYPSGWLRPIACVQAIFGLVVMLFVITRVLAILQAEVGIDTRTGAASGGGGASNPPER
jgi:hypothetical protein